ncbi:alpha/beta fold hydrolase [Solirubrobacter taibaiensis]|nr:alpha/beta fold hydrolase [Solirubrobacter taibaiensis]
MIAALKPSVLTKLMIVGRRAALDRTPEHAYEDVEFPAADGVELSGWFIPAEGEGRGPAVVFAHGWLWNRLGNVAGQVPVPDKDVDFLPAADALHAAGYHVLLFDLSNHGRSGRRLPITYGINEAADVAGAVAYLGARADVDAKRIGILGCSMGANAAIYARPPVKAILAVQPARLAHFNRNYARDELGPMGPTMLRPVDPLYKLLGAPLPRHHNPAIPARGLSPNTVVQYVQGTGDPWGEMRDVEAMVEATPNALPLIRYESGGRYEGYRYVNEEVADVAAFFTTNL